MSVVEVYEQTIKPLALIDRFLLAKLILNDIPEDSIVDSSGEWTDEDLADFANATTAGSLSQLVLGQGHDQVKQSTEPR